jgi:glycosyltransferase involved in cell wall biosynthesis
MTGKLRIALDASHMRQSVAGIARYGRSLATALRTRDDVDVVELGGGEVVPRDTFRKRALTLRQDFLWYPWLGRRCAGSEGAKVYHIPLPRGPLARGNPPVVITVHDLVPLIFPETVTPWSRLYAKATLHRVLDTADKIIAVSKNTADDVESLLGISSDRIRVIYNGVDESFFEEIPENLESRAPYILFVGTPEPRKNLERLLEAVRITRRKGLSEELVIVGGGGWGHNTIDGTEVKRLGRVSDSDLRKLYRGASCVAVPSLHEGFGLTALEAMAAGAPVVAANTGALPEITGGAAILVDPLHAAAIADGIIRCIDERANLSAAGLARAKEFTWKRCAAETAAVYKELA